MATLMLPKGTFWSLLKIMNLNNMLQWFYIQDFNEITCQNEKVGVKLRPHKQMEIFQEAIAYCSLSDIPTHGQIFTWSNSRRGTGFSKERLDKVMTNLKRMELFPKTTCHSLLAMKSNHSPLLLILLSSKHTSSIKLIVFRYKVA